MVRQLSHPKPLFHLSFFAVILLVLTASVLELRNPERGPYDANWQKIQKQGFFVVGTDPTLPPFSLHGDPIPTGLEPEIALEISRRIGIEVRFILLGYDGLYDSLILPYGADMVISTLRPDPFRMSLVRYTSPYFDAGHVLVSTQNYQTLEGLETVAVEFASEGDVAARSVKKLNIVRFFTPQEAMDAILTGEVDAALVDYVSAVQYVAEHPEMGLASQRIVPDPYAIAIRRTDWRLYRAVEDALQAMQADGTLDALIQKWVSNPPTSP